MPAQITLNSFLQAQKISVQKALQAKFKPFLIYREENDRLLMHQLLGLMRAAEEYQVRQEHNLFDTLWCLIHLTFLFVMTVSACKVQRNRGAG